MFTNPVSRQYAQHGVTLIELIMFIVIITVGLVGILSVMNIVTRSSADPMIRKQATAMAEAVLEEVLSKNYCDPDLVPQTCVVSREADRSQYDDIEDYNGQTIAGNVTLGGPPVLTAAYTAAIVVAPQAPINGGVDVDMRRITVTVNGGGDAITLFGYRAAGF